MKQYVPVFVALAAFSLAGCGGGSDDSKGANKSNDSGSDTKCADIWKVGKTLNLDDYEGCQDGDTYIVGVTSGCYDAESNYIGQTANFEKRLWVVQKGTSDQTGEGGTPGKVTDVDPKC